MVLSLGSHEQAKELKKIRLRGGRAKIRQLETVEEGKTEDTCKSQTTANLRATLG